MELPKTTTQIGEPDRVYRVFIEDYVISYMKQLCREKPDVGKRFSLYGHLKKEESRDFYFIYGGSMVEIHESSDKYIGYEDREEMEEKRKLYFEEYSLLGWITIADKLPEVIYLERNGKTIQVGGYHIFYEKNDSMLAYMIQNKQPSQETPEPIKEPRMETEEPKIAERKIITERKNIEEKENGIAPKTFRMIKAAMYSFLLVLCVIAVMTLNGFTKLSDVGNAFQKALKAMTEKRLPDKQEEVQMVNSAEIAVKETEETEESEETENIENTDNTDNIEETKVNSNELIENEANSENTVSQDEIAEASGSKQEPQRAENEEETEEETEESITSSVVVVTENEAVPTQENTGFHIIQKGENLLYISRLYYGNENQVKAICQENNIENPDKIQIGQKIILP